MQLKRLQVFAILTIFGLLLLSGLWLVLRGTPPEDQNTRYTKAWIRERLRVDIEKNHFPHSFRIPEDPNPLDVEITSTLDPELQNIAENLLRQYHPDYAGLVVLDAGTGRVLAMTSYNRDNAEKNYALIASFPAASVFKLVTATAALDQNLVTPETILPFNGAHHTLYKRNVLKTDLNRWTNYMTLKEAFAQSVNTFFGKLGLYHVGTDGLEKYAERYGFNRPLPVDLPLEMSTVKITGAEMGNPFSVAEAASGYNHSTTLSPLHGALMAASVINNGLMMEPYAVQKLSTPTGDVLYQAQPKVFGATMKQETAELVRELMRSTVERGTSRKAFRHLLTRRLSEDVEMGGKTGSLTGLQPKGRTDWFVGYLRFHDQRIAFGAVTVHEKLWRVRSSQLASEFFKQYMGDPRLTQRKPTTVLKNASHEDVDETESEPTSEE